MSRTSNVGFVYRQYTKDGIFMADYKSSREAAEAAGTSSGAVVRAAHGERKTGGGFIWKKVKEETPQDNIEIRYHDKRPVLQMDLEGTEICQFNSIAHASRATGISRRSLSCALNGAQKTAGGYRWMLKEE